MTDDPTGVKIIIDHQAIRFINHDIGQQVNAHWQQLNPFWAAKGCYLGCVRNFFWAIKRGIKLWRYTT